MYEGEYLNESKYVYEFKEIDDNLNRRKKQELSLELDRYMIGKSKDLGMIIPEMETYIVEQKTKADFYEKRYTDLLKTVNEQNKTLESFGDLLSELTDSYKEMNEDCLDYKKRNKELWKCVEELEKSCENYLKELESMKLKQSYESKFCLIKGSPVSMQSNGIGHEQESSMISLKVYSEEITRKLEIEKSQRLNMANKAANMQVENNDLNSQVMWLEHRLKNEDLPMQTLSKNKWKSLITLSEIDTVKQVVNTFEEDDRLLPQETLNSYERILSNKSSKKYNMCPVCGIKRKKSPHIKNSSNCSPIKNEKIAYHDMFEEIFKKLKRSRNV